MQSPEPGASWKQQVAEGSKGAGHRGGSTRLVKGWDINPGTQQHPVLQGPALGLPRLLFWRWGSYGVLGWYLRWGDNGAGAA